MFTYDSAPGQRTFGFFAAFHLGLPLTLCETSTERGWEKIREDLEKKFAQHSDRFEPVLQDVDPEICFPLGKPLSVRYRRFIDAFDFPRLVQGLESSRLAGAYSLDNLVWICPSGIVLIIGWVSYSDPDRISLLEVEEKIFIKHYTELTYIFSEVAEVVLEDIIEPRVKKSPCASQNAVSKIQNVIRLRQEYADAMKNSGRSGSPGPEGLLQNKNVRTLYDDILMDVFFVEYLVSDVSEQIRIGYVDATVQSTNPQYVLMIAIAYASFVGLLWLLRHLGEKSRELEKGLSGRAKLSAQAVQELKLFKVFCLRFINESNPISIHLKRCYMERLESCWEEFRMNKLVLFVNDQLLTLEKMFDWIDDRNKQIKNTKIGLAAIFLTLASITAVAASLISTIDVGSRLDWHERLALIILGLAVGSLGTMVVYALSGSGKFRPPLRLGKRGLFRSWRAHKH